MHAVVVLLVLPVALATHYEDPAKGCGSDEQAIQVQGVSGDFCSPPCNGTVGFIVLTGFHFFASKKSSMKKAVYHEDYFP